MVLSKLLAGLTYEKQSGDLNVVIDDISYDSRKNTKGTVFVQMSKEERYLCEAVVKGAVAVVICDDITYENDDITVIKVDNPRHALAHMSCIYFDYPQKELFVIGITGTKGKTTTAYMIHNILVTNGIKTGLIGTIETIYGEEWYPQENTTPESYNIYELLRKMVLSGCEAVVMEVSSQGIMMGRIDNILFDIAVFTNISEDHIGTKEHKSFEEYLYYKSLLFKRCRMAVVNNDDIYAKDIKKACQGKVITFGINNVSDLMAYEIKLEKDRTKGITFRTKGIKDTEIELGTFGIFNVYNALAALCTVKIFSLKESLVKKALKDVIVKGRIEILPERFPFTVIIDYAHNDLSLKNLLTTLREYKPARLICCFGCGGNRDRGRRFKMGEVSGKLADITVVTSDNPRYEKPEGIIEDIVNGIKNSKGIYIPIVSRKEAIEYTLDIARTGDIIVFAGKGHEDYQEINGVKTPFNERFVIRDYYLKKSKVRKVQGRD